MSKPPKTVQFIKLRIRGLQSLPRDLPSVQQLELQNPVRQLEQVNETTERVTSISCCELRLSSYECMAGLGSTGHNGNQVLV